MAKSSQDGAQLGPQGPHKTGLATCPRPRRSLPPLGTAPGSLYISDPCKQIDLLHDLHMQLYKARVNYRYSLYVHAMYPLELVT